MAEAGFDVARQLANIENFIQMGCDVILINPVGSADVVPGVEASNRAGVPVVMLDIDAEGGIRTALVTSDNERMGRFGGEYLAWRLKGKGKIVVLDWPALDICRERSDAAIKVFDAFPGMEVVAVEHAVTRSMGLEKMENILQANPELDGVYAINDGGGLGAYYAIKAAGRSGEILIAAVDGEPPAVELIKAGTNYGLDTSHFARVLGRTSADVAHRVVQGETVPYKTVIPVFPITIDSLSYFPGRDSLKLPPRENLIPTWYATDEWKELAAEYGYEDWKQY